MLGVSGKKNLSSLLDRTWENMNPVLSEVSNTVGGRVKRWRKFHANVLFESQNQITPDAKALPHVLHECGYY